MAALLHLYVTVLAGVLGIAYGTSSAILQDRPKWPHATAMGINYFGASYAILCKYVAIIKQTIL
jgi:hypothetical protein